MDLDLVLRFGVPSFVGTSYPEGESTMALTRSTGDPWWSKRSNPTLKENPVWHPEDVEGPPKAEGSKSKHLELIEELFVQRVSVMAEDGPNGKPQFSIVLELDCGLDPSNRFRRTERVTGLALEVEEKEIPVLARLAGRQLSVSTVRETSKVSLEELETRIQLLEETNQTLRDQKRSLEEQVHFLYDQQRNQQ